MPDGYTDVQLNDGTTLRFNGENLDPLTVKTKVAAYRAGVGTTAPVNKDMKMSAAPRVVRGALDALPSLGAAGGGMLASPGVLTTPLGAGLGAAAGSELRQIGNRALFGEPKDIKDTAINAATAAGTEGAMQGLTALGDLGMSLRYSPATKVKLPWYAGGGTISRNVPEAAPTPRELQEEIGAFMNRGYKSVKGGLTPGGVPTSLYGGPVDVPPASGAGSLTSTGPSVSLSPANMPPAPSAEGVEGTLPAGRNRLIKTPEEFASADQRYKISQQLAHERGMNFAAGEVPASGRKVPRISPMSTTQEEAPMVNMEQLQRTMGDPATTHGAPDAMGSTLEGTGWKVRSRYPDMNMTEIGNPNHNYTITVRDSDLANPDAVRGRIRVKDAQAAQEMQ